MNLVNLILFLTIISITSELIYGYTPVDLTLQPNAMGRDVAEASVRKVNSLKIVADDHEFLLRLSYVESGYGCSYASLNTTGGLWGVSSAVFLATQDPEATPVLTKLYFKISSKFRINWLDVTEAELTKPLYSALAAMLYTKTLPEPIPDTMAKQADYWAKYYHPGGSAKVFTNLVTTMQNSFVCRTRMDTCFVLDGSGSIAKDDFEKARKWIVGQIDIYEGQNSRFCLVLFSTDVQTIFNLDNKLNKEQMIAAINGMVQPRGNTNTRGGITTAVDIFKASQQSSPGEAKTLMVLTDGQSTGGVEPAPTLAKQQGIQTMAWGVGPNVNQKELLEIANGDQDGVDLINNYSLLFEKTYHFKTQQCNMPQQPPVGVSVDDNLYQGERRFYHFKLPPNGINVIVGNNHGRVVGYFSFTVPNPTAAEHDGQFTGSVDLVKAGAGEVFVATQGVEPGENYYTITAVNH